MLLVGAMTLACQESTPPTDAELDAGVPPDRSAPSRVDAASSRDGAHDAAFSDADALPDAGPPPCQSGCGPFPQILGHRGMAWNHVDNPYPENSVLSAAAAIAAGAAGVEIDVSKTVDHVIVLAHDNKLSTRGPGRVPKTDCRGLITESTWAELESCHSQSSMPGGFVEPLGRLEDLLVLSGLEFLVLDVKNDRSQCEIEQTIDAIATALRAAGARDRTVLMLYTQTGIDLAHAHGLRACIKRHLRRDLTDPEIVDVTAATGAWGQCSSSSIVTRTLMDGLRGHDQAQVTYWLGHDQSPEHIRTRIQRFTDLQVYGVITDVVAGAVKARRAIAAEAKP